MIHGKDSNIKPRMILCTLVLLFPAQTNVDLVRLLDSLSELLNVQPLIIHLIFMFLLPITSNTGGNQDTLDWRGRVPMYSKDLWLEGKRLEMRRKSSGGGLGLNPACGASAPKEAPGGFTLQAVHMAATLLNDFRISIMKRSSNLTQAESSIDLFLPSRCSCTYVGPTVKTPSRLGDGIWISSQP